MKIIHTYLPTEKGGSINKTLIYLMSLSFLLAKKLYKTVILYTDEDTKKLVNKIGLKYDEINTDIFNGITTKTFSIPKLIVYANQTEPFIHIDLDSFIYHKYDLHDDFSCISCFPEGKGNVLRLHELNIGFYKTYIKNTFDLYDILPEEFSEFIDFTNIPNMSVFGGQDYDLISKSANYCLNIYNNNKERFDDDYFKACVIEQLFMSAAIKMYKYKKDINDKKPAFKFLFDEIPTTINFMDKTNEYPFEFKTQFKSTIFESDEDLFKKTMFDFDGFLHVNGYKNFDKLIFLIKQRILIDFNGNNIVKRIEDIFGNENDPLSEKYLQYLKSFSNNYSSSKIM